MLTEAHDVAGDTPGVTAVADSDGDAALWQSLTGEGLGLCEPTGAGLFAAVEEEGPGPDRVGRSVGP